MRIGASLCASPLNSTSSAPAPAPLPCASPSIPSVDSKSRCKGLDLLALAVLHVSENGAPVPEESSTTEVGEDYAEEIKEKKKRKKEKDMEAEVVLQPKRRRRHVAVPSKYQDSVLQPWKRRTRRTRCTATS